MTRHWAAAVAVLTAAACATVPAETNGPAAPGQPAPPPPNALSIPAGTVLTVRLAQDLDAGRTRIGDTFTATAVQPLIATNQQTVIPEGAVLTGMVTGVGATEAGQGVIRLNFLRIALDGISHPITARIVDTAPPGEQLPEAMTPAVTDTTAAAPRGVVMGGELRAGVVGAVLGAGAGSVVSLGDADGEHALPEGTVLRIQTRDRVDLRP